MQEKADQKKHWDRTYSTAQDFFGKKASGLAMSALSVFKDNDVRTVLDLGCGQGRDTWYFAKNGLSVTALDYSEAGICQMADTIKREGLEGAVTAKVHDARKPMPFPDASFDAVYSHMFFTMELSEEEMSMVLQECRRVLRPGGINIYSVRNDHDPHYGKFIQRGKDMWQNPNGFVVHFLSEERIRALSGGYELLWIREFEEPSQQLVKKLYEVALRKPGA